MQATGCLWTERELGQRQSAGLSLGGMARAMCGGLEPWPSPACGFGPGWLAALDVSEHTVARTERCLYAARIPSRGVIVLYLDSSGEQAEQRVGCSCRLRGVPCWPSYDSRSAQMGRSGL